MLQLWRKGACGSKMPITSAAQGAPKKDMGKEARDQSADAGYAKEPTMHPTVPKEEKDLLPKEAKETKERAKVSLAGSKRRNETLNGITPGRRRDH